MEGPYRDLGAGFARLAGSEGARRSPSRISSVEDAVLELLRNARDAGAKNIYVASTLRQRRYRKLTVLDDGGGIPESHRDLIFEPGVTTRHIEPVVESDDPAPHGAGLSLYHLKNVAVHAGVLATANPTSITVTLDTRELPERALQAESRHSRTNLLATLRRFIGNVSGVRLYYASPAGILSRLIEDRAIERTTSLQIHQRATDLGLEVSLRTVQRILGGEIQRAETVTRGAERDSRTGNIRSSPGSEVVVSFGQEEKSEIEDILRRIVRARFLEVGDLRVESRPGEITVKAQVYELEDEYE